LTPDGRAILFIVDAVGGRQMWRLPYPPGTGTPERVMSGANSSSFGPTPRVSWFANGRDGVVSSTHEQGQRLWFAAIRTGPLPRLRTGTPAQSESLPALSPDGKKLLYVQSRSEYLIVSASLADASVQRVISSELSTGMPAWPLHQPQFVYDSGRSRAAAI